MKNQFIIPVLATGVVAMLFTTLVTVALRSPYTHANLTVHFDSGYTRTEQSEVGAPLLYRKPPQTVSLDATTPMEERGRVLLATRGCAGCHGIDGKGGVVAPAIIPDLEVLRDNVRLGPRGMPVFSPEELTDHDLTAITAYLKSVNK